MLSVARIRPLRLLRLLLPIVFRATLVHAAPTLSFPINSQVPPVARIGEPFSFVFSDKTFISDDRASLSYALTNPPAWLSLDSHARTFSGTPQDEHVDSGTVVGVNFTLVATDSTGSTPDDATLVVSRHRAPSVQIPIADQIRTFGHYSEPSSILFSPEESFQFTFATDTFAYPDDPELKLNYYSVLVDNSPLPAWLSFDARSLAFAGTTPPFSSLVAPPQTFSVKLIASDVTGFAATSLNFSIVVGSHALTTHQPHVTLNATTGQPLAYRGLAGSVQVDGQTANPSQVNATTEGLPSWLAFDQTSWNISGTPSKTAESTTFAIIMKDAYADVLNVTFSVQLTSAGSLFTSAFPAVAVMSRESFSFDLSTYLLDPSNVDVTTDIRPATSWISWDASSLTLTGDAPISAPKSVVDVTFTAAPKSNENSKRAVAGQSQQLVIQIEPALHTTTSSSTSNSTIGSSTSSSTTSSSASTAAAPATSTSTPNSIKWTIIAIVISILAGLAILAELCFWCCTHRKKNRNERHSHSTLSTANLSNRFPEESYIHTPGHPVHSPDQLQRTTSTSPNAKEKATKKLPTTFWNASNLSLTLRRDLPAGPAPAGFGLGAIYNDHDQQPSKASTPVARVKDWFASLRSFTVVHVRPANRRASTDSDLPDEGRSFHTGADPFDVEAAAPYITLDRHAHGSEASFRGALEVHLPAFAGASGGSGSRQATPEAAYSAERVRAMRRLSVSARRVSSNYSKASKGTVGGSKKRMSVQQRDATPEAAHRSQQQPLQDGHRRTDRNPFMEIHETSISPLSTHNPDLPLATNTPISPTTPPPSPTASTTGYHHHHHHHHQDPALPTSVLPASPSRPLQPTHSQKSLASTASSSLSSLHSRSRKLGRKVSAQLHGARFAIQSPKRRQRSAAQRAHGRYPVLEDDDESVVAAGRRSASSPSSSPTTTAAAWMGSKSDLSGRSPIGSRVGAGGSGGGGLSGGGGGIARILSPRAGPQPSASSSSPLILQHAVMAARRSATVPEQIRRRPVAPSLPPLLLCTPVRDPSAGAIAGAGGGDKNKTMKAAALVSSPFGLRVLDAASGGRADADADAAGSSLYGGREEAEEQEEGRSRLYADIASSSPYGVGREEEEGEEEANWTELDASSSPPAGAQRQRLSVARPTHRMVVGAAMGGEEEERPDVRVSVAGASARSEESQASSGGAAFV